MRPGLRKLTRLLPIMASILVFTSHGFAEDELLAPTRLKVGLARDALKSRLVAPHLLTTGRHDDAYRMVSGLKSGSLEDKVLAARILIAVNELEEARPFIEELIAEHLGDISARRVAYRWWVIVDDLARVAQEQGKRGGERPAVPDLLATANLRTMLLDFDGAVTAYEKALDKANDEADRSDALHGLGVAFYRKRDFDKSFEYLKDALGVLESRTQRREDANIEGTHAEDGTHAQEAGVQ